MKDASAKKCLSNTFPFQSLPNEQFFVTAPRKGNKIDLNKDPYFKVMPSSNLDCLFIVSRGNIYEIFANFTFLYIYLR